MSADATSAATLSQVPSLPVIWSGEWAPFLDIDGTLLDIAAHPDDVFVPPALIACLERLAERCGSLALVTGRSLDQVDALFGAGRFDCAANHGAVVRIGGMVRDLAGGRPVGPIVAFLEPAIAGHGGVFLEEKGHSVAVHYRAAPGTEPLLIKAAYDAIRGEADAWRIVLGKAVVEIAPRGTTKGTAIEYLLGHPVHGGRRPFFAGDDITDEDAFAAVARHDGMGVLVGPERRTAAQFRLPSPDAFRNWLARSLA